MVKESELRGHRIGEIRGVLMHSVRERENDYAAKKREERPREVLQNERSINGKLLPMYENNACHFDMSILLSLKGLKPFGPIL